jgi:hypothetical protein
LIQIFPSSLFPAAVSKNDGEGYRASITRGAYFVKQSGAPLAAGDST